MTTICLIRHGETDWNAIGKIQGRTDIPEGDWQIKDYNQVSHLDWGQSPDAVKR